MAALVAQLAAMAQQLALMQQELRELRRENVELRRRAEQAEGLQQHQPYAVAPLPQPVFTFTPPRGAQNTNARSASQLSPAPIGVTSSPPADADHKRTRRQLPMEPAVDMVVYADVSPPPTSTPLVDTLPNDQ
jgi:hypothetical protein